MWLLLTTRQQASTSDFYQNDLGNWNIHIEGLEQRGDWTPDTYYRLNDLVTFGNVVYRVTQHTPLKAHLLTKRKLSIM